MTSSSQAGSRDRANHSQSQEKDSVQKTLAISGRKCLEQYEKLNLGTLWVKMFVASLVGTGDWYSTRCNLTWKLRDTKSSRWYFQLAVSTPRIGENGLGLLPTVRTVMPLSKNRAVEGAIEIRPSDGKRCGASLETLAWNNLLPTPRASKISGGDRADFSPSLPGMALKGMLPTPNASDYRSGMANRVGQKHNQSLNDRVAFQMKNGMLPTPAAADGMLPTCTTRDWKGARTTEALQASGRNETNSLPDAFAQSGRSSQLNPRFVAEMMGFPENWTELPFLSGEAKV